MTDIKENKSEKVSDSFFIQDHPIDDFEVDYFGYKSVAKDIARSVSLLDVNFGYVIAINGKWGSGKTSFLYYVEQYLTERRPQLELGKSDRNIVLFRFDPWLFSGHQDIVSQFFLQLEAQYTIFPKGRISTETREILAKIFNYGSKLRVIPTLESQIVGWGFAGIGKIIESKINKSLKSILELKNDIKLELQKIDDIIVIIIDDIDRLTAKEIRELFRAIKAVADFPNVVYLLAYDEEIVASALDHEFFEHRDDSLKANQSRFGIKYLEKIVHFNVHLPVIGEHQLKKYTEDIIFDKKFLKTKDYLFDKTRWTILYNLGISHFLRTPRNVIRLHNTLALLYPAIENEVNVIDFIELEIIRQNYPGLYNKIKENPGYFIKTGSVFLDLYTLQESHKEKMKNYHKIWIENEIKSEDQGPIAEIISDLFPHIGQNFGDYIKEHTPPRSHSPRELHINENYDIFLKYFRYQNEPDLLSNFELVEILNNINEPYAFSKMIAQLSRMPGRQGSKAFTFFENIFNLIDPSVPERSLRNLIIGVFLIDKSCFNLKENFQTSFYSINTISDLIEIILYKAINLFPREKRFELLKEAYSKGTAFHLEAGFITIFRQQNDDWGGKQPPIAIDAFVSLDELKIIEDIFITKVQEQFSHDLLNFASPNISHIIYVYNKLRPDDQNLLKTINEIWEKENVLIEIIHSSYVNEYNNPIAPHSLEPYKSEEDFRLKIINILKKSQLTKGQQVSLEQFLTIENHEH